MSLVVDSRQTKMQGFVADLLEAVVRGVVTRLRGCEDTRKLVVRLRQGPKG